MGLHGTPPVSATRRWRLLWPWLLLLPGCEALYQPTPFDRLFDPARYAAPAPAPAPPAPPEPAAAPPETVVAMAPIPDPPEATPAAARAAGPEPAAAPAESEETRLRHALRRNPWLTRFWSELTAAQQVRVERGLRRAGTPPAEPVGTPPEGPAGAWDSMGLADRARLVLGPAGAPEAPGPAERREGSSWASRP
ncbi:hypothetical protein [Paracraurococcus lichenis]|uniref:DUF3106 domain-containing protein n=1 Tax=Paracraurococcus lichenis TaxID=3064888 RepID=A0ABT9DW74_9PROT|nr:hypothetical protein [Paracraurococcus sp. LOR1-02]MDO9708144.1 hypothetical protein [Paracraurococcus sp. LOR1-02]